MKTKRYVNQIHLLAALLLATSVQAQYTFGPEVQKTPSANITYDSGTGLFQYTDIADSSDDQAYLPLIGTAATYITTSNGWTVSLTANISARSTTATSDETPHVGVSLALLFPNGGSQARITLGLGQINNTGGASGESSPDGFYGTVVQFAAVTSGGANAATPLGGSTHFPDGNLLVLSGGTNESPATESLSGASGVLTLGYDASTKTVTGYFNGTPAGSYSPDSWSNNPKLTLAVDGISGEGVDVSTGTATASDFSVSASALAQFQWARRIASAADWPEGEPNIGLALDTNDNCYVTGFFDGTNDFGGVTLTNQSVGGSDVFVAKYDATGTLQWVQRAGGTSVNYGRAIGVDADGNIYVTGGYSGSARFGGINLPVPAGEGFFLAKYNNAGAVQWVQSSTGGSDDVYGIGLTVDSAGNTYALVIMDDSGSSITFGTKTVTTAKGGHTLTILVKYDNAGSPQWAKLFDSTEETYATKLAVDSTGNVYVRGSFDSDITIGNTTLTAGAGSARNIFIAKFNSSGTLSWIQQPQGDSSAGEGGVAVDPAGDIYISGAFTTNLNFGGGIVLTNTANDNALFGDAFVAKYNSSGAIQWAQPAGGTDGGFYWDLALDAQTNVYAAGFLGSDAAVAKYNSDGMLQWMESASGPPASPVSSSMFKCAVDSTGNCYLAGFYQGTATFGTTTLQPQEAWNFFLTEVGQSITGTSVTIQTSGASFGVRTNRFGFDITGASNVVVVIEASTNLINPAWIPISTNTLTSGTSYFSDPQWTNYPGRFYRIGAP
jgi:Beta-propeller repeat